MEERQQCQRNLHLRKAEWSLHFALHQLPLCPKRLERLALAMCSRNSKENLQKAKSRIVFGMLSIALGMRHSTRLPCVRHSTGKTEYRTSAWKRRERRSTAWSQRKGKDSEFSVLLSEGSLLHACHVCGIPEGNDEYTTVAWTHTKGRSVRSVRSAHG